MNRVKGFIRMYCTWTIQGKIIVRWNCGFAENFYEKYEKRNKLQTEMLLLYKKLGCLMILMFETNFNVLFCKHH